MATAKITLIGFYNYMISVNDDLFKNLSTPTGIDKSLLVNNILLKGGEFEVLYAEPYFLQNMIGVWSQKWQRTMERWINALSIDYNPLENYDRMEDWTDDASRVSNEQKDETSSNSSNIIGMNSSNNSENNTGSETTTRNENALAEDYSASSGSGTTANERSAFDSSVYDPHDKSTTNSSGENVSTGMTSADGTTETSSSGSNDSSLNNITQNTTSGDESRSSNANAVDNSSSKHAGRIHGNIGVTTSQTMLESELSISKWNLYDEIADLFISEFCIYLY